MMLLIFHLLSPAGAGNVLRSGRGGLHPEEMSVYADIIRIGLPTSVQNMIYTGISFVLTQFAAGYGDLALAVLRMGNQIESVSWNISDGFAASINAFTAQNYGARQRDRIRKGYDIAFRLLGSWGLFVTAMFLLFPEQISGIFFHEAGAIRVSAGYLRIVGLCEAFMCIESMTVGALSGLGKTRLCSAVSITLTGLAIASIVGILLNASCWKKTLVALPHGVKYYTLIDEEALENEQIRRSNLDFAPLSYSQVYDAGDDNYIDATLAYQAFAQYLMQAHGLDVLKAADVVGEVYIMLQNGQTMQKASDYLDELGFFENQEKAKALLPLLIDFNNTSHLWPLKGNTPERLMKHEADARGKIISFADAQKRRPKVGRNDPCPCGSGKKYKNCCLKKDEGV